MFATNAESAPTEVNAQDDLPTEPDLTPIFALFDALLLVIDEFD